MRVPYGVCMWREMASALGWPGSGASLTWQQLTAMIQSGQGWAAVGHPEWGALRFAHTHPVSSTSGLLTVMLQLYADCAHSTGSEACVMRNGERLLTLPQVWNNDSMSSLEQLEQAVEHLGKDEADLLDRLAGRGPSYLHAVPCFESRMIEFNQQYGLQLWPHSLAMIYPADGDFFADHPLCLVDNATWSEERQLAAAGTFIDFLLSVRGPNSVFLATHSRVFVTAGVAANSAQLWLPTG